MRPSMACAKPFHAVAAGDIETWTLELPPDRASSLRKRLGSGADRLLARPNRERVDFKQPQPCVSKPAYPLILLALAPRRGIEPLFST